MGRLGLIRIRPVWRTSLYTSSFYLMAANVTNAAFGFLFWTLAARLYPAQEVGLAAATVSAVGLLAILAVLGLDYAVVRFLPRATDAQGLINSSLTIGTAVPLALSLVFIVGLSLWSPALLPLRQSPVFVVGLTVAAVCATVSALLGGVFLARKRAELVLAQAAVFNIIRVLFAVILVAVPHALGLIGAWALGLLAAAAGGLAFFLPRVEEGRYRFRLTVRREVINDMTHFAFTNYVAAVLWSAPVFLMPLLVVNVAGPEANAYFYVASNVSGLLAMIPVATALSLFAHGSHDEARLVRYALDSARFILLLLIPAVAAVFLFGGKVLLLFGSAYSEEGTRLLWLLAASTLPMTVNFLFFSVRRVQQQMAGVVASTAWILAVTMGLGALLLPTMGLLGAGVAWFAAQSSVALVLLTRLALDRRLIMHTLSVQETGRGTHR